MTSVTRLLQDISEIGRDSVRGGYTRPVYSTAETELREWFMAAARARRLDTETDRNGIIWAWWDTPDRNRTGAIVTGSHLDSVPGGGAFDGPLGVASALAAVDILRARGHRPSTAIALAVFPEEEGSRYGVACLDSRLFTGAIDPDRARNLTDSNGNSYAEASRRAGIEPRHIGPDAEALSNIGAFIELHVEQGRGLVDLQEPVAIGGRILAHGRWRISIRGEGNHAGTTRMEDRRDPLVAAAHVVIAIQSIARSIPSARATVGRIEPTPGGTNVIASRVDLWLDARHPDEDVAADLVEQITRAVVAMSAEHLCEGSVVEESSSPTVAFDRALTLQLAEALPSAPLLDTGAGHDAGILAARLPSAMLFVRNPSGISHSPEEYAEDADAEAGALALADVLCHVEPEILEPVDRS